MTEWSHLFLSDLHFSIFSHILSVKFQGFLSTYVSTGLNSYFKARCRSCFRRIARASRFACPKKNLVTAQCWMSHFPEFKLTRSYLDKSLDHTP